MARKSEGFLRARTAKELAAATQRQIRHLRSSIAAYDAGNVEEAERLSSAAYILLHSGYKQSPLLGNALETLQLPDSRCMDFDLNPGATKHSLCGTLIEFDQFYSSKYIPRCTFSEKLEDYPWVAFREWWVQTIYNDYRGRSLTRQRLVTRLRSKDGGGHVDQDIDDENYYSAMHDGTIDPYPENHLTLNLSYGYIISAQIVKPEFLKTQDGNWAAM